MEATKQMNPLHIRPQQQKERAKGAYSGPSLHSSRSDTFLLDGSQLMRHLSDLPDVKYPKFFPIVNLIDELCPSSSVDKLAPDSMLDIHTWFRICKLAGVYGDVNKNVRQTTLTRSISQPHLAQSTSTDENYVSTGTKEKVNAGNKKLTQRGSSARSGSDSNSEKVNTGGIDDQTDRTDSKDAHTAAGKEADAARSRLFRDILDRYSHTRKSACPRFGTLNEKHCEIVAKVVDSKRYGLGLPNRDRIKAELFVQADMGRGRGRFNVHVCQVKTEMAHQCLQSFFFPSSDVTNVTWVRDLKGTFLDRIFEEFVKLEDVFDKPFSEPLGADDILAVLFLTEAAIAVIRHRDLCMLDTLALSLGIKRDNLVLLEMSYKPSDIL